MTSAIALLLILIGAFAMMVAGHATRRIDAAITPEAKS